jgi:chromate reductase
MVFLNIPLLQQPEVYLSNIAGLFNDRGEMIDQSAKDFLRTFAGAFAGWVRTVHGSAKE